MRVKNAHRLGQSAFFLDRFDTQFTIGGTMHILLDLKTCEVFSFDRGWNKKEASIRTSKAWMQYIYMARDVLKDETWQNRILVAVPLPHEQEEFT